MTPSALLAVLLALVPTDLPPLMPEVPPGWQHERYEFPLPFAPGIALDGHEELRLPPGMFERGTEPYSSYLFGLHLEGLIEVDEAFLQPFLEQYYRGLAESTRGDKEVDLDAIQVGVLREVTGLVARVDTFDTFTDGQALSLRLEFLVHHLPDATEVLVLVSPHPADGRVWSRLRGLGERWWAVRLPAAYLNHLYVVPDEETYAAIAASDFLRDEFGIFEERTTVQSHLTYTGAYLYGDHTYFEFLRPDPEGGFASEGSGIAFGFDRLGATARHSSQLEKRGITTFVDSRTRELDGKAVPWFEIMGIEQPTTSQLKLFTLEYDQRFLQRWHADAPPALGGISRAAVLERYAAHLERHDVRDDLLLENVTSIRLALDEAETSRLVAVCRSFGYQVDETEDGTRCLGPGLRLEVTPSDTPGGITGFDLALRRPVEARTLELGRLTVTLQGQTASFDLAQPPAG